MAVLILVVGLVLLAAGGESLVRGASSLARTIGMSSLMVGLTVVSFATSAPELAVSAGAVFSGHPSLAVGNVLGSNIANVLLVLGLSALFTPLIVRSRIVRTDIPVMVALSTGLLLVVLDGTLSRFDGALLLMALLAYVTVTVIVTRRDPGVSVPAPATADSPVGAKTEPVHGAGARPGRLVIALVLVALGVALLVVGARLLVDAAGEIAAALGVSDLVIGLTVVAVGTSLPELATSVVAVIRGERDLAVGNIVGSNMFNIGFVLGATSIVAPQGIDVAPAVIRFDLPIMLAVSLALLPVAFTGLTVARWEGALFVGYYGAYIGYLALEATGHDALQPYSAAMLWFVVPLTALWLTLLATHELSLGSSRREGGRPEPERPGAGER
ncbi:calcium/sodium antiporter [Streptomyces sp. NPDC057438]|uniref:calcium/sodium antiporter n=1 Tax=Streptomyces sp. NPDC057438 TaxID=3346133 RepID=UPI0036751EDF